ncbi:MAG: pentapeptide repeat-containing protein, partial [Wolinella succinogenes]|uniref:pentapeptide repeat-containing protein n=1 Tax=Wolinella succinogenes TaxID=844 RepID=UPI0016BC71A4
MEKSARTLDPESFKKRYEAHFPRANSSSENARFLKWCLEQKDIHIWNRWRSLWNEIPSNDENPENHSFKVANLIKVDLAGANLEGADLRRANLVGANLEGADLKWVSLVKANLAGANLEG